MLAVFSKRNARSITVRVVAILGCFLAGALLFVWHVCHPTPPRPRGVVLGGVLVVNLDSHPKKWYAVEQELLKSRVLAGTSGGIRRLSATDGTRCDLHQYLVDKRLNSTAYDRLIDQSDVVGGHYMTVGALGCFESHVRAWERVVASRTPTVIFEDDVSLRDGFDVGIRRVLAHLPTDFDLCYLGNIIGKAIKPALTSVDGVLYAMKGQHYGTYAYIISPSAALTLLRYAYPAYAQVDSVMIDIALEHSFDVYMSKRVLIATDNAPKRESATQRYAPPPLFIPQVFHFCWLGEGAIPQAGLLYMERWMRLHPAWGARVWNRTHLPPMPPALSALVAADIAPGSPLATNIVRYAAVLAFGGVFIDADVVPSRPLEPILRGLEVFVAHKSTRRLSSAVFGAVAGHALMQALVNEIPVDSSPVGGWETAGWRTGANLVTSLGLSMGLSVHPRARAFATHVFFPDRNASSTATS